MTTKVLIAENSKVLAKLIEKSLEELNLEILICDNGLDAIKTIIREKPDCVIIDKYLPEIDGTQVASVLKAGNELINIPIILFSAEDKIDDFWTKTLQVNAMISLNPDNMDELVQCVKELVCDDIMELESFDESVDIIDEEQNRQEKFSEEGLFLCSVRLMEKNTSYITMLKQCLYLVSYMENLDELAKHILQLLYEITGCDVVSIVIKDNPIHIYSTGLKDFPQEHMDSFLRVCKADYEVETRNPIGIIYEEKQLTDIIDETYKGLITHADISSYMMIPVRNPYLIGSIHIGSTKKKYFTYKTQSLVQNLSSSISDLLKESILHRRITLAETRLRETFSKFVPEEIIDDMIAANANSNDQSSNNEKRKVAVLICDIRNFTTLSEINQPENVVGFLNGYFTLMVDIIKKHGGSIDKFIGDAIMCLFGAPISYVDNAQRAVEAALEMVNVLPQINTSVLNFPNGINFDIGIGIHYGEVIVGNIGCKDKTDYTVIGDSVNLCSRIEGLTKQYGSRIMISQAVQDELTKDIPCMKLDKVRVKGKTQGVEVYRVDSKPLSKEYQENYEKGLTLYFNGAWTLAVTYFENALKIIPNDKASILMFQRCEEFIKNPPDFWNGAVALTSK